MTKPIGYKKLFDELISQLSATPYYKNHTRSSILFSQNLSILIAEDNSINQFLFTSLLAKHNIQLTLANDGKQALKQAKTQIFDLIIVDLQMPVMGGIETAKCISTDPQSQNRQTPIIAISANLSNTKKQTLKDVGIIDALEKPFDEKQLIELITQATQKNSSIEEPNILDWHSCINTVTKSNQTDTELLKLFIEQLKEEMHLMKRYYEKEEWHTLQALVHKIHGGSCFVDLPFLKDSLKSLEQALMKNASANRIHALYHTLMTDIEEVLCADTERTIPN